MCVCVCVGVCVFQGAEEKWANGDNGREYNLHCAVLHGSLGGCNGSNLDILFVCRCGFIQNVVKQGNGYVYIRLCVVAYAHY